jgi:geranylgeranyl diphosphate synthase type 3
MLHNASLMIDDVQDDSILRRGIPATHKIYGVAQTINCANFVYFLALEKIQRICSPHSLEMCLGEILNLHRGQGMELYWRDNYCCPTQDEYLEMISNKTGGLLRLAVKLMQHSCEDNKKEEEKSDLYSTLVTTLGKLYQVRDDYINLKSVDYFRNKSFCEDLTEGKFSFPIIHSIHTANHLGVFNGQLLNIVKQKTREREVKEYALKIMESTNSFQYTRSFLRDIEVQARDEIEKLGGNDQLLQILEQLKKDYQ